MTASVAAAGEISVNAAVAAALSELDGIFTLEKKKSETGVEEMLTALLPTSMDSLPDGYVK